MAANIFFSLFSLIMGISFLLTKDNIVLKNITVDVSSNQTSLRLIGIILIFIGIYLFYRIYQSKTNQKKPERFIEFSKCSKCKEVYNFQRLHKGMCPTCNIPTVDMDVYFKVHKDEELSD